MTSKKSGQLLLTALAPSMTAGGARGRGSNGHCHYNAVVVMAVQRRRGLVQGAALNCQGIAVRFYRAAHLGKLFLHSGNAVTLFNAQPPGVE